MSWLLIRFMISKKNVWMRQLLMQKELLQNCQIQNIQNLQMISTINLK